jgi:NADH-quinone oxidoreductase subunit G
VVTPHPVREDNYAAAVVRGADYASLGETLKAEPELAVLFDDSVKGDALRKLVAFGESLGIPVKYVCLVDYANSRGAIDMGVTPELLPGYVPSGQPGMRLDEMIAAPLDVLWVVGANPLKNGAARQAGFMVVQDLFLTQTAAAADVVLPAASAYEKNGTVTNSTGEVQRLKRAAETMGTKTDLEIMGFLAREMGVAASLGPWSPDAVREEIRENVPAYAGGRIQVDARPDAVRSDHNGLFASGTLGRYSKVLHSVLESRLGR